MSHSSMIHLRQTCSIFYIFNFERVTLYQSIRKKQWNFMRSNMKIRLSQALKIDAKRKLRLYCCWESIRICVCLCVVTRSLSFKSWQFYSCKKGIEFGISWFELSLDHYIISCETQRQFLGNVYCGDLLVCLSSE